MIDWYLALDTLLVILIACTAISFAAMLFILIAPSIQMINEFFNRDD